MADADADADADEVDERTGRTPEVTDGDRQAVGAQLGRPPRGLRRVAHRCSCGLPDVVEVRPRLEDGTPFPTVFWLTCRTRCSQVGTLESSGLMARMTERLDEDEALAAAYAEQHRTYLEHRRAVAAAEGLEPLATDVSAGGMPGRVKCLHVLLADTLARGPGVSPFGDEVLALLGEVVTDGPCVAPARLAAPDDTS